MGRALARELAAEGVELVVYNRTQSVADEFAAEIGASTAATARELAERTDFVLALVADGPALIDLIDGIDGLAAGLSPGGLVVDMGTSGIDDTGRARSALAAVGAGLVEAPVSGSVPTIQSRSLLVMVAGDDIAVDRVTPVLEIVSKRILRMGGPGTGAAMKLAVNSVLFGLNQAISEALVLAERAGIDRSVAYDVFEFSAVGAPVVSYRRPAFERPGETEVTASIDLGAKDLGLALTLAERVGALMPQCELNRGVLLAASGADLGAADLADVTVHLRRSGEVQG
jgi:3-hydroxyisobutyrate dehydrogenase/2-hydroxy-3-oxopropionate reductase